MLCENEKCQVTKCQNQVNVRNWRIKNTSLCSICNKKIKFDASYCKKCLGLLKSEKNKERTIREYQNMLSVKGKHPSSGKSNKV